MQWQVGKRNKDLSRKAPYVSERPHTFQKGPICFKRTPYVWKRDPYVAHMLCFLKDFLPHMLKKLHMLQTRSPYVAHMQPISGPYVSTAVVNGEDSKSSAQHAPTHELETQHHQIWNRTAWRQWRLPANIGHTNENQPEWHYRTKTIHQVNKQRYHVELRLTPLECNQDRSCT